MDKKRIVELDIIRGIAISVVLLQMFQKYCPFSEMKRNLILQV